MTYIIPGYTLLDMLMGNIGLAEEKIEFMPIIVRRMLEAVSLTDDQIGMDSRFSVEEIAKIGKTPL